MKKQQNESARNAIERKGVVGYVRTAVANNNHFIAQEENIKKYCEKEQLELVKIFYDVGPSGSEINGTGWLDLKSFLAHKSDQISGVIVDSLDRIGRDVSAVVTEVTSLKNAYQVEIRLIQPLEQGISKLLMDETRNIHSEKTKMGIRHAKLRKKGNSM